MGGKGDGGKHDSGTAGPDDVVGGGRGGDVDGGVLDRVVLHPPWLSASMATLLRVDFVTPIISGVVGSIAGKAIQRPSKRITVNEDRDTFGFSGRPHSVFVPVQSVSDLKPLQDLGDRSHYSKPYRWVDSQGGCDLMRTTFQFVVHAHNATVDIIGAEPIVEAITPPPGIALVQPLQVDRFTSGTCRSISTPQPLSIATLAIAWPFGNLGSPMSRCPSSRLP